MRYATYLLLAVCLTSVMTQELKAPDWAPVWSAKFSESSYIPLLGNKTTNGVFMYQNDGVKQRTKVIRENGKTDRYCGTVYLAHNTRCDQVVQNGKRYLVFPDKKYCCMCCTAAEGCGIVKREWASTGKFTGVKQGKYNEFLVQGLQSNWMWYTPNGIPKKIFQAPQSDMIFDETSYNTAALNENEFKLPTYNNNCEQKCPLLSVCGLARNAIAS